MPHGSVICWHWIVSSVSQSVRSLPSRLALCDLEAPGEPWFPHCAALLLTSSQIAVWFFLIFYLVDVCHTNLRGDTMLLSSPYVSLSLNPTSLYTPGSVASDHESDHRHPTPQRSTPMGPEFKQINHQLANAPIPPNGRKLSTQIRGLGASDSHQRGNFNQ